MKLRKLFRKTLLLVFLFTLSVAAFIDYIQIASNENPVSQSTNQIHSTKIIDSVCAFYYFQCNTDIEDSEFDNKHSIHSFHSYFFYKHTNIVLYRFVLSCNFSYSQFNSFHTFSIPPPQA